MALIRSEHVNDQAVREAKEAVQAAESALEEARAHLEKRERAQYHEEQIWSDTIRRNSTWVTFGLMGLNIFLLLASLVAIEPWRRSRMVKEIKRALDAQRMTATLATVEPTPSHPVLPAEARMHVAIEPAEKLLEELETVQPIVPLQSRMEDKKSNEAPIQPQEYELSTTTDPASVGAAPLTSEQVDPQELIDIQEEVKTNTQAQSWSMRITSSARDLFSDRTITVRKIDLTAALTEAAFAGAILTGALIVLLRSK